MKARMRTIALLSAVLFLGHDAFGDEVTGPARWNEIAESNSREDDPEVYWLEIQAQCYRVFHEVTVTENFSAWATAFVDEFGKNNATTMKWILCDYRITMPRSHFNDTLDQFSIAERTRCLAICEAIVRRAMRDPVFLKSYYRSVIWNERFFGIPNYNGGLCQSAQYGLPVSGFRFELPKRPEYYWYYARNFVLMCHAYGRDDLIKNIAPESLRPQIDDFVHWFPDDPMMFTVQQESLTWKRSSQLEPGDDFPFLALPKFPALQWTDKVPPRPRVLRDTE
jgi:hypothetical protein